MMENFSIIQVKNYIAVIYYWIPLESKERPTVGRFTCLLATCKKSPFPIIRMGYTDIHIQGSYIA